MNAKTPKSPANWADSQAAQMRLAARLFPKVSETDRKTRERATAILRFEAMRLEHLAARLRLGG